MQGARTWDQAIVFKPCNRSLAEAAKSRGSGLLELFPTNVGIVNKTCPARHHSELVFLVSILPTHHSSTTPSRRLIHTPNAPSLRSQLPRQRRERTDTDTAAQRLMTVVALNHTSQSSPQPSRLIRPPLPPYESAL